METDKEILRRNNIIFNRGVKKGKKQALESVRKLIEDLKYPLVKYPPSDDFMIDANELKEQINKLENEK